MYAVDEEIDALLRREQPPGTAYTRHFNQSEDFFLKLDTPFEVPSFSIHHDVREHTPAGRYREALRNFVDSIQKLVPGVFQELRYAFDPTEILRPVFYKLFRADGQVYLFHIRIDLVFRPQLHEIVKKGTNDTTPVYRTNQLTMEVSVVPIREVQQSDTGTPLFVVDQMISDTWIGETGRGYFVQGIWIDADLTKFFSKLILPRGKRVYPYYPFNSKFRTICHTPVTLEATNRGATIPVLHRVRGFLAPHVERIQSILREEAFSESLPLFEEIKATVPAELEKPWETLSMKVYLNDEDMKEFEVIIDEE